MSHPAAPDSSFGEKLFDSNCKALVASQSGPVDAAAEIWTLGIMVKPSGGSTVFVAYTEARVEASNYRVSITASNGQNIALSQFGNKYDNFAKKLSEGWGNALAKALLMEEANVLYEAPCFYAIQDSTRARSDSRSVQGENLRDRTGNSSNKCPSNSFPFFSYSKSGFGELQSKAGNKERRNYRTLKACERNTVLR